MTVSISRRVWLSFVVALAGLSGAQALAESAAPSPVIGARFVEGTHYQKLPISVDTRAGEKIEVVELFSYACIHCYNFEPHIQSWKSRLAPDVAFQPLPAVFNKDWELLAQAYYTAETLGVTEQVHQRIFEGIHQLREDLRQPENLAQVFADIADVSGEDFDAAYNSFSVRSRVQQAKALVRAYRATGVPAMVVHGKYLVDGQMAGGNTAMLEVVDYLVNQERATGG